MVKKFSEMNKVKLVKESTDVTQVNKIVETQPETQPQVEGCDVSKFFSKLFESREIAHVYHLQVRGDQGSYASHVALNTYYDSVLEFIDELIETYQGQYEIVDNYQMIDTSATTSKDKIEYFQELASYIKEARKCISAEDTHLHNIIDEIVALVYKTLYKLRFNK